MADLFGQSAAARAASLFSYTPDDDAQELPGVFSMSIRMPIKTAATVIGMSEHAGLSRNEMANLILKAGIESIFNATPEPLHQEIYESITDAITTLT